MASLVEVHCSALGCQSQRGVVASATMVTPPMSTTYKPTLAHPCAAGADGAVAVAANFVNKFAMMILPLPNSVLLLQTVTMLAITRALHVVGVVHVPPLTASRLRQLLPLSLAYTVHASLVLRSLISLNIPMYNTLKRLTPVMVLVAKVRRCITLRCWSRAGQCRGRERLLRTTASCLAGPTSHVV